LYFILIVYCERIFLYVNFAVSCRELKVNLFG
jgi:hypothetical protein